MDTDQFKHIVCAVQFDIFQKDNLMFFIDGS